MKRINYKQVSYLKPDWIKDQIKRFILEDAPQGDLTSQGIIDKSLEISARMIAADNFIFCGQNIIPYCFPSSCQIKVFFKDGNQIFEDDHSSQESEAQLLNQLSLLQPPRQHLQLQVQNSK